MIRYLIEKAAGYEPYMRPGTVIEVHWSRTHGYMQWIGPTKMSAFIREWGQFLDLTRRDLFIYPHSAWLAAVHDDGITLVPLDIASLKKNTAMLKQMDVQNLTISQLAKITARAMFALVFPVALLAILAGVAADVATIVYQFTTSLF